MDILPTKRREFQPVILYLPGYEKNEKQLIKEKPELWKIFKRLSASEKPVGGRKSESPCSYNTSTLQIPNKDGMKCMCYEGLMRIITEKMTIPPPKTFRLSNGKVLPTKTDGLFPTWAKRAIQGYQDNEERQLPMSTLVVRWQLKRHIPSYDKNTIKQIFERFGPVTEVQALSPNSSILVFRDLKSACHVNESQCVKH